MSSEVAVSVQSIGKCYHIFKNPRDRLKQFVSSGLRKLLNRPPKRYFQEFWALNDVSFEVKRGETIGIIGRNGSGKSTLLQIICGTLAPTAGEVETNGRVAALLELGSGFNPEFTGRENVYMNAAVLGLSKKQVDERFDKIAAFADIGRFMEQPVKIYSSGMYIRLAFSVIAHVDADVLVVDEALSVGDAIFTQKCMRFIRSFRENGTLVFVSHDTRAVQNLCEKTIWLDNGEIKQAGASKDVVESYLKYTLQELYGHNVELHALSSEDNSSTEEESPAGQEGMEKPAIDYGVRATVKENGASAKGWKTGAAEIMSVSLKKLSPGSDGVFTGGERVRMAIRVKANETLESPILGFLVRDRLGQDLFGENTLPFTSLNPCPVRAGEEFVGEFVFRLPMLPNGQYAVMASVADGDLHENVQHHWLHDALIIDVSSSEVRWGLVGVPFEQVVIRVLND